MDALNVINKRMPNIDGVQVVTGQAQYTSDVSLPGMLVARVLRSPYAHARIIRRDASKARGLDGVFAVVTAEDTPKKPYIYMGPPHQDRLPLADQKVRFIGEEVAAVAALDGDTAARALDLIEIEYEPLPAVFEPEEAMRPGAPLIHENKERNISQRGFRTFGDPDQAFRQAAVVVEGEFDTQGVQHCCMEPYNSIARWNSDGQLEIWTSTQAPYYIQKELAYVLDLEPSRIRIHHVRVGGGFGGRSKVAETEAIVALLAMKVPGRPVALRLTRREEFETRTVNVPMRIKLRTAADATGKLLAREMHLVSDNGAYNHCAPGVSGVAASMTYAMYRVPNARAEHFTVYTNKQATAQMRGYGEPQAVFAIETQMDEIAETLGIDPLEFRKLNAIHPNETLINGWRITSCGMVECLDRAATAVDWSTARQNKVPGRGVGIASLIHGTGGRWYADGDYSSAMVRVGCDGVVTVETGAVEIGQWSNTTLAQVAAETLGCRLEQIRVVSMDTDRTPSDLGAFASKTAFLAGNAVQRAALDARRQILDQAAAQLQVKPEELTIVDGHVHIDVSPSERCMPIGDLVLQSPQRIGLHIIGRGFWESDNTELFNRQTGYGNVCAAYIFGAHAAEVQVDVQTGQVKIVRLAAAIDVGRALNPMAVEGQIEGAVMQGIGFALFEKHTWDEGRVVTNNLMLHKIPGMGDMPRIIPIIVETNDPAGPFGAKGVGEPGLVATAACIANAVYDAVGVRIRSLPLTPEKVLLALQEKHARSAAG